jgi:hypothetical protein
MMRPVRVGLALNRSSSVAGNSDSLTNRTFPRNAPTKSASPIPIKKYAVMFIQDLSSIQGVLTPDLTIVKAETNTMGAS